MDMSPTLSNIELQQFPRTLPSLYDRNVLMYLFKWCYIFEIEKGLLEVF